MMNWFLTLPLEVRLIVVAIVGVLVGTQVNRGIYRLAWFRREIGPWSPPAANVPPRSPFDRIPIVGWWWLRRESAVHGSGFWIRPLLIELFMGIGFSVVYGFEVGGSVFTYFAPAGLVNPDTLHWQVLSHFVLITLMTVATFIDLDEKTIPDAITLPGTLIGLMLAAALPTSRSIVSISGFPFSAEHLHLASGTSRPAVSAWPTWLHETWGLVIATACLWAWCFAILPGTWTVRRGMRKAMQYWLASLVRRATMTVPILAIGVIGSAAIAGVWLAGGVRWESLLSALVGMAAGGATIWSVRIVGSSALQQEAMGFGDVTLMAMVGAFVGWQPTLIIFFLAPFAAIFIAVAQYVVTKRHDIAFGPYLCLGTLIWLLASGWLWMHYGLPMFSLGWFVPAIFASGLMLMWGMLMLWRIIRDVLFPWEPEEDMRQTAAVSMTGAEFIPWPAHTQPPRSAHPLRNAISLQPPSRTLR